MTTHASKMPEARQVAAARASFGSSELVRDQRSHATNQRKWQQLAENSQQLRQLKTYQSLTDRSSRNKVAIQPKSTVGVARGLGVEVTPADATKAKIQQGVANPVTQFGGAKWTPHHDRIEQKKLWEKGEYAAFIP